jgi:hypothetical protein
MNKNPTIGFFFFLINIYPFLDIALSINLVPSTAGTPGATNVTSFPIASTVDVSKSSDSMKRNGNLTYYEHSVNYQIPSTVPAGSYNVVFFDSRTNTHLDVPINVRPAAAASASLSGSAAGAAATAGTSGNQRGSTFKSSNDVSAISPFKKTIIALVTVAATAAFML